METDRRPQLEPNMASWQYSPEYIIPLTWLHMQPLVVLEQVPLQTILIKTMYKGSAPIGARNPICFTQNVC